jgi:prolipoprotein diacylglyceryltransferase
LSFPYYIPIGNTKVLWHSLIEPIAFFVGFRYFLYLRSRDGDPISTSNRTGIFIGAIFGALLGSHLIGGLENPVQMGHANHILFYFIENKTVLGGFLGGLFGVELVKKQMGEKRASGDLFVFPMILALIIGRLGCFSMGIHEETYGIATKFPWGMNLGDGIRRHPVTLYEIAFLALLWAGLVQVEKRVLFEAGARFKLFMIAYLLFRFFQDFIKPHYTFPIGLSTIQLTSLVGLLYYCRYILHPGYLLKKHHHA